MGGGAAGGGRWGCGQRADTYVHLGGRGQPMARRSLGGKAESGRCAPVASHLPSPSAAPSPQDPPGASWWWPRRWGEAGGCPSLREVGVGFLQAQTQGTFQAQPPHQALSCPPPPAPGLLPGPPSLGLTWGAGQRVLSWRLMWGWPQGGPLNGSYGIVWRVQLLGGGLGGPAQLSAGHL